MLEKVLAKRRLARETGADFASLDALAQQALADLESGKYAREAADGEEDESSRATNGPNSSDVDSQSDSWDDMGADSDGDSSSTSYDAGDLANQSADIKATVIDTTMDGGNASAADASIEKLKSAMDEVKAAHEAKNKKKKKVAGEDGEAAQPDIDVVAMMQKDAASEAKLGDLDATQKQLRKDCMFWQQGGFVRPEATLQLQGSATSSGSVFQTIQRASRCELPPKASARFALN